MITCPPVRKDSERKAASDPDWASIATLIMRATAGADAESASRGVGSRSVRTSHGPDGGAAPGAQPFNHAGVSVARPSSGPTARDHSESLFSVIPPVSARNRDSRGAFDDGSSGPWVGEEIDSRGGGASGDQDDCEGALRVVDGHHVPKPGRARAP